jgi:hypothetical protein
MADFIPSNPPTKEDLQEIVRRTHAVAEETYWCFFRAGMGAHCHAFLEFNGVLSKYVQICGLAAEEGIDFTHANVHSNTPLPVEAHDVEYLAEKLGCILGPLINANPEARKAFARAFFGPPQKAHEQEEGTES